MAKFTIVMPITQYSYLLGTQQVPSKEHNNFQRFMDIGLRTYLQHLQWNEVHEFIVIVPSKEQRTFQKMLRQTLPHNLRTTFNVITEEGVLEREHGLGKTTKSRKQMLCKLCIAKNVKTQQYLVVDDDVILLRPFGYQQLFTDASKKYLKFTPDHSEHRDWWSASCEALGLDMQKVWPMLQRMRLKNWVINVTPQVFDTNTVQDLILRFGGTMDVLYKMPGEWTEYTLYWLHLMDTGRLKQVYRGSRVRISDGSRSVWYACDNLEQKIREMAQNSNQYFGVVQSNVPEHTVAAVKAALIKSCQRSS